MFISLEGIEGSGKTTQIQLVAERLKKEGCEVLLTFEPGGTAIGEKIRALLLDPANAGMEPLVELFLYNAARIQHLNEVIVPALKEHKIVLTDRFSDSTIAYQGYGRGIDLETITDLCAIATHSLTPDVTIFLDLEVAEGLKRNKKAGKMDRIDGEDLAFHERVRQGFFMLSKKQAHRYVTVDASLPVHEVTESIIAVIKDRLKCHSRTS